MGKLRQRLPIQELLDEIKTGENTSLYKIQHPLKFVRNNARGSQSKTYGYEATLLIDLCNVIIKAGESGDTHIWVAAFMRYENLQWLSPDNPFFV